MGQSNQILQEERNQMEAAVQVKSNRIKEIEEERGIAISELKILLASVQEEKRGLQSRRDEERDIICTNLRHTISLLAEENARLRAKCGETPRESSESQSG